MRGPPWAQWESTWWPIRHMCHGNKSDSSASASQNGQHFTFVDKNDLAIPPLDCCHLRSARLVSLIPPSLYSNHFASEASPWLSKLLPPQNISYPISALFFFLLSSYYHLIFFIHVVCLSPPLECKFHEGIWSLVYPRKQGQYVTQKFLLNKYLQMENSSGKFWGFWWGMGIRELSSSLQLTCCKLTRRDAVVGQSA